MDDLTMAIFWSWVPMWVFFNGIAKCIRAWKGLSNDGMDLNTVNKIF